jgi:hypothetical protein
MGALALSVANAMGNRIGKEQLAKLREIMRFKPNLVSLCGIADDATEADLSGLGMDAGDAAIFASELPEKGALSKFIFGGDDYKPNYQYVTPEPATLELGMTEADFSNKNLGVVGAIIISAWLTHKDNGGLSSVNVSNNNLWTAGIKALVEALKDNQIITELNISVNGMPWDSNGHCDKNILSGVIALSNTIRGMGALIKLDISSNYIAAAQGEDLQRICAAGGIELVE